MKRQVVPHNQLLPKPIKHQIQYKLEIWTQSTSTAVKMHIILQDFKNQRPSQPARFTTRPFTTG